MILDPYTQLAQRWQPRHEFALGGNDAMQRPTLANDASSQGITAIAQLLDVLVIAEDDRHGRFAGGGHAEMQRHFALDALIERQVLLRADCKRLDRLKRRSGPRLDVAGLDL